MRASNGYDDPDSAAYIPLLIFITVVLLVFFLTKPSTTESTSASIGTSIMGALCGKQSADAFSTPGRTLAAAPPSTATSTSPVPASARKSAARTLGVKVTAPTEPPANPSEARRQAALAAEVRHLLPVHSIASSHADDAPPQRRAADAKKSQGRLATQLNKERGATQAELLKRSAEENKGHRMMDANAEALRHD